MISSESVGDIIDAYEKHDWHLRRVLLTERPHREFADDLAARFPHAGIREAGLDAVWFSRAPGEGKTAWELRSLGARPFALVEHVDEAGDDFEQRLEVVEHRMITAGVGGPQA